MPYVCFGTKDDEPFELEESPNLIAVRTRSGRSVRGFGPVAGFSARHVSDGSLVAEFVEAGVEVYRVPAEGASLATRKTALRSAPDVRFAGSVLVLPGSEEPILYTENLYVRFEGDCGDDACETALRDAGLRIKEKLGFATNAYFVAAEEGTGQGVFDIAMDLLKQDGVVHSHPELIQRRATRTIFPEQWHLTDATVNGTAIHAHAHVAAAHEINRGAGVTIAVIDDGVDVDHPEFQSVGKVVAPRDATRRTGDPRPKGFQDNHGTACAGVACADGSVGASGVAPESRLMPILLASGLGSIAESHAFKWAADNGADVISCSWGPPDGPWFQPNHPSHNRNFPLPASAKDAIDYAVTQGRGGKGCVILWAAGNGNESVDNDGYARYDKVIAVAACNDRSRRSIYSDFGDAIWCAFPSNDFEFPEANHPAPLTPGIWTTDRRGFFGYNRGSVQDGSSNGDFTNSFGGTSSACPGAAGVAALVLSVNPGLRWDEVKDLLKRSCDRIDPGGGNYDGNGHSPFYGYGRLNAATAVSLADGQVRPVDSVSRVVNLPIEDRGTVEATLNVPQSAAPAEVSFRVKLRHTYVGDLVITALPPDGSDLPEVVLQRREGGSNNDLDKIFDVANTPALEAYGGQDCSGVWTLRVEDQATRDTGTLVEIAIHLIS